MSLWSVPGLIPIALVCATATGLPPVATSPHSGATSAASRKLVKRADALARDEKTDEAIALLRQAVATEPANHDARTTLANVLLEKHPDEALAILTELRDARCRACLKAVTGFIQYPNSATEDAAVNAKLEALANAARDANDNRTLQFLQWFIEEQVEEERTMTSLLDLIDSGINLFQAESHLASVAGE